jgi:hypothetical protein
MPSSDRVSISPVTDAAQWRAWREFLISAGRTEIVARLDRAKAAGRAMKVPAAWPPTAAGDEARRKPSEGAGAAKQQTPLSLGASWLGFYNTAEAPRLDANGALAKAGLRPSDKLIAITTRREPPLIREIRWAAADFLRAAPALRRGQHVDVEFERAGELKTAVAIVWGILIGVPEVLTEEACTPYLQAHPLTRKHLLKWWTEQHLEAEPELAEAALKAMSPRELQNAVLMADNAAAQPMGGRHQVNYRPDAELWRIR